jgi:inward rectifier potassium channel
MSSSSRQRFRNIDNSGFSPNSSNEGGRLINPDGSANLRKTGVPFWNRVSLYHTLLRMPRAKFFLTVILFYTVQNIFFATLYFLIGVDNLTGMDGQHDSFHQYMEAFFFSAQTLTTVGYGRVAPTSYATNFVASAESLIGILTFALVTGLIYGRFARPRAYVVFSNNILVAPYQEGKALMLRLATYKNNHLTDVEAQLTLALHIREHEKTVTRFYPLKLEISKINSLALNWTIVHAINEDSPLYHFTKQDVLDTRLEVIVNVKGFDDHFSNIVQQRTSFTYEQLIYGARYLPMYRRSANGQHTVLELDKISSFEPVKFAEEFGEEQGKLSKAELLERS